MDEKKLREAIRNEIKKALKERSYLDRARKTVSSRLGRVENLQGVKLLKRALSQGSADQRAAGILNVVKSLADNDQAVIQKLKMRLQQKGVRGAMTSTDEV
tara:strand:- start:191 stop:493 length:303 start_codon:yes stop_codon:yes gene_type:complete